MTKRYRYPVSTVMALLLLGTVSAYGQADAPSPPAAKKGQLDKPYVDGSFGFSVIPPAGSSIHRQKQIMGTADVEIVHFVNLDHQWSMAVRLSATTRPIDTDMIVDSITSTLAAKYKDVKMLYGKEARIAGREGMRYAASFATDDNKYWLRQQAVVRSKPKEYYTIILLTPLNDRDVATKTFDKIAAEFKILRTEAMQKQIRIALDCGIGLLQDIATNQIKLPDKLVGDTFLRCVMDGKEIGFIQINEQAKKLNRRDGVAVHKWAWLFKDDDSITYMEHNMFLANDLSFEKWENRLMMLTAPEKKVGRCPILNIEQGIRNKNQLLIAYTPKPNAPELKDKAIEVESSFAPAPWDILLPRLIDLNKPELYAFLMYDSTRRGLSMRTIRVIGPSQVLIEGRRKSAYKLEDSEGLTPPIHEIYVDKSGRLMRLSTEQLQMTATTKEYIEKKYSKQVQEAVKLFKKYPVQQPKPSRRNP